MQEELFQFYIVRLKEGAITAYMIKKNSFNSI